MRKVEERYRNDPVFYQLVQMLGSALEDSDFTPMEMREAAMYAQYLFELRHSGPVIIPQDWSRFGMERPEAKGRG